MQRDLRSRLAWRSSWSVLTFGYGCQVLHWIGRADHNKVPLDAEDICEIVLISRGVMDSVLDLTHVRRVVATAQNPGGIGKRPP